MYHVPCVEKRLFLFLAARSCALKMRIFLDTEIQYLELQLCINASWRVFFPKALGEGYSRNGDDGATTNAAIAS